VAGYGSDIDYAAWLAANGHPASPGTPTAAVLRQRGSSYIDSFYGARFSGFPTTGIDQERAWPRAGASAYGTSVGSTVIPRAVVLASYLAALQESVSPGSLSVTVTASQQVKREKVGPIEVEYQSASGDVVMSATPMLSAVEGLLAGFLTQEIPAIFAV